MKRAAIYARVSRADQNVAMQLDEGGELVKRRGWELADTFRDDGVSGATAKRPNLDRMLAAARRRRFDVLVVWKSDRLFRSLSHMVRTLDELAAWGVDFVSVTEPFDTRSPTGKLLLHIVAAMAEFERAIIAERSAAGVAAARRRGKRIGRPRVYVDVSKANKMLQNAGVSLRDVAEKLKIPKTTLLRRLIADRSRSDRDQPTAEAAVRISRDSRRSQHGHANRKGSGSTSKAAPRADGAHIDGERKSIGRRGGLPRASGAFSNGGEHA